MDRPENYTDKTTISQLSGHDLLQEHKQLATGKSLDRTNLPNISLTDVVAANADGRADYAKDHKTMSNAMLDNTGKPAEQSATFSNSKDLNHDPARYAAVPDDRSAQPGPAQPNLFDGMSPTSIGHGSNDSDLTSYKVWQKDKDIRIETATKNIETIKLAGTSPADNGKGALESCSISQNGKEIASVKSDNGKLKYEFTDLAQNHQTISLRSAEFDSHNNVILKTDDNQRIELRADGSEVSYDDKSGHPLRTIDSNGNEYKYRWDHGDTSPSSVTIQGPMTSKQLLEFDKAGVVDNVLDNTPNILGTSIAASALSLSLPFVGPAVAGVVGDKFMTKAGTYKVFVEGREQGATLSLGAGAGIGTAGAGVSASMGMPVQRSVNIGVLKNGGVVIDQPSETWNGMITHYHSSIALLPDGTSTLVNGDSKTPIRRATNGMVIEKK